MEIKKIIQDRFTTYKKYEAKKAIFEQGDVIKGVYYILKGSVKLIKKKGAIEIAMWFAEETDIIGISSFFNDEEHYTFSAVVPEDASCKVIFISRVEFSELLNELPSFKNYVIHNFCKRLGYTEYRINNFKHKSTKQRIADALLFSVENHSDKKKNVRIRYSIRELAEIVGASKDYLLKVLKEFQEHNIVLMSKHWMTVYDTEVLAEISK